MTVMFNRLSIYLSFINKIVNKAHPKLLSNFASSFIPGNPPRHLNMRWPCNILIIIGVISE